MTEAGQIGGSADAHARLVRDTGAAITGSVSERIRGRRRSRMSAEGRRSQILEVATRLIAERGFWATSLREVGDACGITVAGVLHHFPSKEALLVAVLDRRDQLDEQVVSARLVAAVGAGEKVTMAQVCREIVARNAGQRELVQLGSVLSAESLDPQHPAHEHFRERQRWVLEGLAECAPVGSDAAALARHALALLEGLELQWLRDPSRNWVEDWDRVAAGIPEFCEESSMQARRGADGGAKA